MRILLMMIALMFAAPSVGAAQDFKVEWWGPFTAVGTDMDKMVAMEKAFGKAKAGMHLIADHLPSESWVAGFRTDSSVWSRGKNGEHILTLRYSIKVYTMLPLPDLPKGTIWR